MESKVSEGGLNVTLTIRLLMHGKVQKLSPAFGTLLRGRRTGGRTGGRTHAGPSFRIRAASGLRSRCSPAPEPGRPVATLRPAPSAPVCFPHALLPRRLTHPPGTPAPARSRLLTSAPSSVPRRPPLPFLTGAPRPCRVFCFLLPGGPAPVVLCLPRRKFPSSSFVERPSRWLFLMSPGRKVIGALARWPRLQVSGDPPAGWGTCQESAQGCCSPSLVDSPCQGARRCVNVPFVTTSQDTRALLAASLPTVSSLMLTLA